MYYLKHILLFVFLFVGMFTFSQQKVLVNHADSVNYDEFKFGKDIQVLIGNVKFKHQTAVMFCDTALRYAKQNIMKAHGNVKIVQNDTIVLYGDSLIYNGNTNIAQVRGNVRLENKETTLITNHLDYNRATNVGYYFAGGKIINNEDTLTSKTGYYYPNTNEVFFKKDVVVKNPKYTMYSDTLIYNTISKISKIEGPTRIVSDDNVIYSEKGYYDMTNNIALLSKKSILKGEQTLSGDTIFYDRKTGLLEIKNNMVLTDTANNVIITSKYGFYNEKTQKALATDSAVMMQVYKKDTIFLNSDTLQVVPILNDTIKDAKLIKAFHHVQFFRKDMQGRCDSMVFDSRDTTNVFYKEPIVWSFGNQLTADKITMFTKNGKVEKFKMEQRAFVISREGENKFNQIKGKIMVGFVHNNEIDQIDVDGSAQSIYYPKDKKNILGVNKAECSNMTLYMKKRKVQKIIMRVSPTGEMNPIKLILNKKLKLDGFYWLDIYRPKNKFEIFNWKQLPVRDRGESVKEYNLDDTYIK